MDNVESAKMRLLPHVEAERPVRLSQPRPHMAISWAHWGAAYSAGTPRRQYGLRRKQFKQYRLCEDTSCSKRNLLDIADRNRRWPSGLVCRWVA